MPDWLEDQAENAIGTNYGPAGGRFGGRDTRKVQYASYTVRIYLHSFSRSIKGDHNIELDKKLLLALQLLGMIRTDEVPSLLIKSFATVNLPGFSTE